jgi:DNA topoisomerase-3
MNTAIIAEKLSVAHKIAAIVGATKKEEDFMTGNGYLVTYAFGHLIQLAFPEDYGFSGFVKANLPIIPQGFILKPQQVRESNEYKADDEALKQLKVII